MTSALTSPSSGCLCVYVLCLVFCFQVALEYLLKGPTTSGEQVKAEVKSKLSDEHIKVGDVLEYLLRSFDQLVCSSVTHKQSPCVAATKDILR